MPNTVADAGKLISLVACFNSRQEMLLLKRPDDVPCGGFWSFPGGKVEAKELPLQAAVRELEEESGLKGRLWRHLGKSSHRSEQGLLHFLFFTCQCHDMDAFEPESQHAWVKRDALVDYSMPVANEKLVHMLFIPEVDDYLSTAHT